MLINWKEIASKIYEDLKNKISKFDKKPSLWIILVWDNPSSVRYVWQKEKWAKYVWIDFVLEKMSENITEKEILDKISEFNDDENIDWFMVQLPLPKHISEEKVINAISPKKDVDWFHPINQGKILIWDSDGFSPCTPAGIMEIFRYENIDLAWKNVCVIGKSNIVWKPISALLINASATTTVCNSKTKNLENFTRKSDIIVIATWVPNMLKEDILQRNSIVIDVGFSVIDGKIYWDAETDTIDKLWHKITPVPWWVWALTVAMLMKNVVKSCEKKK